jgi:CHAT domain-containing protein
VTDEAKAASAELYRVLMAPIIRDVAASTRLVIIPDKWLQFVPFAALYDASANQFLVQRFEMGVTPSVRLFVESSRRYDALHRPRVPSVLAVGDPSFDARIFTLPRLPNAKREAAQVASLYPGSETLLGPAATKRAFLRSASTANVIHFAGHGVFRPDAPLSSYLVLAADSGTAGTLAAKELFVHSLPSTWLAILSGCQTASGGLSATEGVSSLARAFFAAGVPAVIASLWSVDDAATAEFFTDFHKVLSKDGDPSAALQRTQIAWVEKHGWTGASTWAAFTLFGSTAPNVVRARNGVPELAKHSSMMSDR